MKKIVYWSMNSFKGLFLESPIRAPPFLLGQLTDGKEQIRFKDSSLWILTIRGICFRFGKKLLQSFALVKFVPLQPFASGGQHSESNAAYFSWPTLSRLNDAAEDRANYFGNLQKGLLPETLGRSATGQQATTLLELKTSRAFHCKILRRFSLGTSIGFRIQRGILTDIPAILVFVARKVHRQWLSHVQCLPEALEEPGGVWCDVDVVEFSYYVAPAATPKEQLYTELVDGLRGSDPSIGPGLQMDGAEVQPCILIVLIVFPLLADLNTCPLPHK